MSLVKTKVIATTVACTANSENVVGDRLQAYATRQKGSMGRYDKSLACFSYLVAMAGESVNVCLRVLKQGNRSRW